MIINDHQNMGIRLAQLPRMPKDNVTKEESSGIGLWGDWNKSNKFIKGQRLNKAVAGLG
jgi:hypothetical protein